MLNEFRRMLIDELMLIKNLLQRRIIQSDCGAYMYRLTNKMDEGNAISSGSSTSTENRERIEATSTIPTVVTVTVNNTNDQNLIHLFANSMTAELRIFRL